MVKHIFPNFLRDERVYRLAEQYWIDLWETIDPLERSDNRWIQPWFQPLAPALGEGNPIFSAVSPSLKRGIRILQSEPTESGVEFYACHDTFGGTIDDAESIHELVISCALSDATEILAKSLINPWIMGKSVSFDINESDLEFIPSKLPKWS